MQQLKRVLSGGWVSSEGVMNLFATKNLNGDFIRQYLDCYFVVL